MVPKWIVVMVNHLGIDLTSVYKIADLKKKGLGQSHIIENRSKITKYVCGNQDKLTEADYQDKELADALQFSIGRALKWLQENEGSQYTEGGDIFNPHWAQKIWKKKGHGSKAILLTQNGEYIHGDAIYSWERDLRLWVKSKRVVYVYCPYKSNTFQEEIESFMANAKYFKSKIFKKPIH